MDSLRRYHLIVSKTILISLINSGWNRWSNFITYYLFFTQIILIPINLIPLLILIIHSQAYILTTTPCKILLWISFFHGVIILIRITTAASSTSKEKLIIYTTTLPLYRILRY